MTYFLIFDTETTGLPISMKIDPKNSWASENQSRLP